MSYRTEFKATDFSIPAFISEKNGWFDESWHNDICPSFTSPKLSLTIWVSETKKELRDGAKRFSVNINIDGEDLYPTIFETDKPNELKKFIVDYKSALPIAKEFSKILNSWLSPEQMEEINELNATLEYQNGSCATHNFCDPNVAILEAFQNILNREYIFYNDELPETQKQAENDIKISGIAWNAARSSKFNLHNVTPCEVGQTVEYITPTKEEIGVTFEVMEIDNKTNWLLVRANVEMNIKPTHTGNITDFRVIDKIYN